MIRLSTGFWRKFCVSAAAYGCSWKK